MAGSIAKAYVQVIPSADGIKGKLSGMLGGEASSAGQSAGGSFASNLISKAKGLIAAAGIGKTFTDAIMSGSDLEQLKGGVKKIFDEMDTATIMADAASAYKDLNMSANQYLSTINDVGATFAATMGDEKGYSVAKTGLQAISDYATGTGKNVDVLSEKFTMITRSTSSYQSIADQFSGILPATSAGFLEQAQAAGFLSGEYKKLTEVPIDEYQQAVSEMLKKGTEELGLAGNTAAETANTFAGSLAAMKSSFSNFLGTLALGEDIGPSLEVLSDTVFTFISGNLLPMVGNILGTLPEVLSSAFSMAIQGLNMAAANADSLLQVGVNLVTGIGTAVITAAPYLAEAAFNLVSSLGSAILSTDWAQLASDTITSLRGSLDIAAGEILGTDGDIVGSMLTAIASGLPDILATGGEMLNTLVSGILGALPSLVLSATTAITSLYTGLVNNMPQIVKAGFELIVSLIEGLGDAAPSLYAGAWKVIQNIWNAIKDIDWIQVGSNVLISVIDGLIAMGVALFNAAKNVANFAMDAIKSINWLQVGRDIINGLINGISSMGSALWNAAQNVAKSALSSIKRALGISSPSKVMRDQVGKWIPSGVAVGIEANTKPLTDTMHDVAAMTTDTLQTDLQLTKTLNVPATSVVARSSVAAAGADGSLAQIADLLSDLGESTAARQNTEISLLREIIELLIGIEIGDEVLGKAVERYNQKKLVMTGV